MHVLTFAVHQALGCCRGRAQVHIVGMCYVLTVCIPEGKSPHFEDHLQ